MAASEETVFFAAGPLRLEGRLCQAPGSNAVIISHPHPLYGGDLDNPVVTMLADVYQRLGYTALRLNFRGVGASEGCYDDGRGEQKDIRAAAAYLTNRDKIVSDLAGYSFGAWVHLRLNPPIATVRRQLVVAPPVGLFEFDAIAMPPELVVIAGDRDEFAPLKQLRELAPRWHPAVRLQIIPGADHFFWSGLKRLEELVTAMLEPQVEV